MHLALPCLALPRLALPRLALPHLALHRHEFPRRGIGGRVSAFVVDVEAMDNPWPYRVVFGRYASMIEPNLGDRTFYGTWACYNEPMKGWHCVCPRLCLYTTCSTSECVGPNGSERTGRTDASLPPGAHYDAGRCLRRGQVRGQVPVEPAAMHNVSARSQVWTSPLRGRCRRDSRFR